MESIKNRKVLRISRKKMMIALGAIVLLFILGFILIRSDYDHRQTSQNFDFEVSGIANLPSESKTGSAPDYYRNQYQVNPTIEDTREFLKTSYSAEIKTRKVKDTMREIKNAINNADGRIDRLNENEKSGNLNFAIPKSNFENFKDEIEGITNEKLIIENISSENLLSQKQSIEEEQANAENNLTQLEKQQENLITKHNQTIASLNKELTSVQNSLNTIELLIASALRQEQVDSLLSQKTILIQQKATLNKQLTTENASFNASNQNLKNQIDWANSQITSAQSKDVKFTNNIETVNGYISVRTISLWQLARILSPIPPVLVIIVLVIALWYFLKRKQFLPIIQLV
jgi:hypothetical protein